MKKEPQLISARQFSELRGVPYTTVIFWLKTDRLAGAVKQPIPYGRQGFFWQVPDDAPLPELSSGRPAKPAKPRKPAARRAKGGPQ